MLRTLAVSVLLGAGMIAACSPTLNWREVRVGPTSLSAMMPCKPDTAVREVTMAGQKVSLAAMSCETGGITFAVLFADIGEPARLGEALAQWKSATLANVRATAAQETPFRPVGALALPQSLKVVAAGQRPDGSKVESHAAYFARGTHVFQALIYATRLTPDAAENFFSGLKFP